MFPKFAEEVRARRIGSINRGIDMNQLREQFKDTPAGLREIRMTMKVAELRDAVRAKFDKEANEKDLVGRDRRGIEAAIEYQARREAGISSKNERDDDRSPFSLKNMEEGLIARETDRGVEYAAFWDKDGELVAIFKGNKGSVGSYVEAPKGSKMNGDTPIKGGVMTHTHPAEGVDRPFGYAFSGGDISVHNARELMETRAVAREGTYSFRGDQASIPKAILDQMNPQARESYTRMPKAEQSKVAFRMMASQMKERTALGDTNPLNPLNRAVQEVRTEMRMATGIQPTIQKVLGSKEFLVRQLVYQKQMFESYGLKYEFTPAKGYESVGAAVKSYQTPRVTSTSVNRDYHREKPQRKATVSSVYDKNGVRDDKVLAQYRGASPTRVEAKPPERALKTRKAAAPKEAKPANRAKPPDTPKPIKAAPPKQAPVEPPAKDLLGDFFRGVEAKQRGSGLGGLRRPEFPPDFGT